MSDDRSPESRGPRQVAGRSRRRFNSGFPPLTHPGCLLAGSVFRRRLPEPDGQLKAHHEGRVRRSIDTAVGLLARGGHDHLRDPTRAGFAHSGRPESEPLSRIGRAGGNRFTVSVSAGQGPQQGWVVSPRPPDLQRTTLVSGFRTRFQTIQHTSRHSPSAVLKSACMARNSNSPSAVSAIRDPGSWIKYVATVIFPG
jgi:hypothetical protein